MKRKVMKRQYLKEGIGDTIKKGFKKVGGFFDDIGYNSNYSVDGAKKDLAYILKCKEKDIISIMPNRDEEEFKSLRKKYPGWSYFYKYKDKIYVHTTAPDIYKMENPSPFYIVNFKSKYYDFPNSKGFIAQLDSNGNANERDTKEFGKILRDSGIKFMSYDKWIKKIENDERNKEVKDVKVDDDVATSMFDENKRKMRRRKLTENTSEYTKAFREGYEQGYEEGYDDGYEDGYGA